LLTDFGIAHAVGLHSPNEQAAVLGTPEYMSPEQAMGKQVDGRSDVYSLGIVVFHMLTGRTPFQGDNYRDILSAHVNKPLPDPRSLNPDLPEGVTEVLNRATAKDPDQRYPTAGAFAQALRHVLHPQTGVVAAARHHAPIWLYILFGILLGLAALFVAGWFMLRSNAGPIPPVAQPSATPTVTATEAPATPILPVIPATSTPTATPSPSPTATPSPTPTVTPTPTPKMPPRIAYVSNRTGSPQIFIIGSDGAGDTQLTTEGVNQHPFWSQDGNTLYFISDRGRGVGLWSMNPDGSDQKEVLNVPGSTGYAISPNGEHVTYLQPGQGVIRLFLDGLLWAELPGQHLTYQWSPDSQRIVLELGDTKVIGTLDVASSTINPITDNSYASWNPTWSPDSQRVVFASTKDGNAGIYIADINQKNIQRLTPLDAWSQAPTWANDGSLIAYNTGEGGGWNLFLVNPANTARSRLYGPVFPDAPAIWSRDSSKLAFIVNDGDEEIAVINRNGSGMLQLTNNGARDWSPAWEPR
jgi:Tol biopolymer transport system component